MTRLELVRQYKMTSLFILSQDDRIIDIFYPMLVDIAFDFDSGNHTDLKNAEKQLNIITDKLIELFEVNSENDNIDIFNINLN